MTPSKRTELEPGSARGGERGGERGASLILAMAMVTILSVAIVALLGYVGTSLRTVGSVRSQRSDVYLADSAVETAIQTLRYDSSFQAWGACPTVAYPGVSGGVSCQVPNDVPARGPELPGDTAPSYALWAVGSSSSETGISVNPGAPTRTVYVGGPVASNSTATKSIDAGRLDVTGYPVDCQGATPTAGTVVASKITCPTASNLGDPGFPSRAASLPSADDVVNYNPAPVCNANNATLQFKPGYYTNSALFESSSYVAKNDAGVKRTCRAPFLYFRPGVYYFDFGFDAPSTTCTQGSAVCTWDMTSKTIVGGEPKGWDPNTGTPAALVSTFTGGNFSGSVMCRSEQDSPTADGVQFILGGRSMIVATGATVELCAQASAVGSGQQQIAIFGQKDGSVGAPQTTTLRATANPAVTGVAWTATPPGSPLSVVNQIDAPPATPTQYASATVLATPSASRTTRLTTGTLPTAGLVPTVIPSGSQIASVSLRINHREAGPGTAADLSAFSYQITRGGVGGTCTAGNLTPSFTPTFTLEVIDVKSCLSTPELINGSRFAYTLTHRPSGGAITTELDGIELEVTFTQPALEPQSTCLQAGGACSFLNLPSTTRAFVVWGTAYDAPGRFTASLTSTTAPVQLRRGLIARSLVVTTPVPANTRRLVCIGYGNPCDGPSPRVVVLTAAVGATTIKARVQYSDFPGLGAEAKVLSWNVLRG